MSQQNQVGSTTVIDAIRFLEVVGKWIRELLNALFSHIKTAVRHEAVNSRIDQIVGAWQIENRSPAY